MKKVFFTVGPAALYPGMDAWMHDFFERGFGSISHRSSAFQEIYAGTDQSIKELLHIPKEYGIFFCGSASEIWERILLNTVISHSTHFVQGDFSNRFYLYARQWGLQANQIYVADGQGFSQTDLQNISPAAELITICLNETSTGVSVPPDFLRDIRKAAPQALIAVDIVSAVPWIDLPWDALDMAFFSAQKGFGLPTGAGVWVVHPRCLEKAQYKLSKQLMIGAHSNLPNFFKHYANYETPSTPNVLAIYLFGKVAGDLLHGKGKETKNLQPLRAAALYEVLQSRDMIFVKDPALFSQTTIVIDSKQHTAAIQKELIKSHIVLSEGYHKYKGAQWRIGNYPANTLIADAWDKLLAILMAV